MSWIMGNFQLILYWVHFVPTYLNYFLDVFFFFFFLLRLKDKNTAIIQIFLFSCNYIE
jgi:hypothetical protein